MANTRNKVAIVFDGVVCLKMPYPPRHDGHGTHGGAYPTEPIISIPKPSFVKRVPPQRRVFFQFPIVSRLTTPL
ncbi:MAG: hypothetical protein FWH14_06520 [Oscillospiraceae bacterium]|nr:hypothetical protein [Oscillospiraceae bacterium]